MAMYDAKKRGEYKFRLILSIILFVIIIFALSYKGGNGPAATELTLIGFAFCFGSFGHSAWALRQIKKTQERQTNERSEVLKRFIRYRATKPFSPRLRSYQLLGSRIND